MNFVKLTAAAAACSVAFLKGLESSLRGPALTRRLERNLSAVD
jgi:hypothetical protein